MDTKEYQALLEEINTLAVDLRTMGERMESGEWSDEDQETWLETDVAYQQALQRKADEDEKRTKQAVKERVESLDAPLATRRVSQPSSIRRRRYATPRHFGNLRAFRGENAADDAYDCGLWLKAQLYGDTEARDLLLQRQPEWRAQTESTTTAGGFTVPDPLSASIIQVISEVSAMMKLARVWPMTSDTLKIPRLTAGQTVKVPGEATAITASDTTWAQVSLTAEKRATLTLISNELIADSVINFADIVATRAAYEIALNLDKVCIVGDAGTDEGAVIGILPAIEDVDAAAACKNILAGNTWAEATLADLNATKGKLPDKYYSGDLKWLMRRDFHAQVVEKLLYAAGGNVPATITAGVQPSLFGYPIVFSDQMPAQANDTCMCLFGNWEVTSALGMRMEANVARSDDYAFNLDAAAIRVTARWDAEFFDLGSNTVSGGIVGMYLAAS